MFVGVAKLGNIIEKESKKGTKYYLLNFVYMGGSFVVSYFQDVSKLKINNDYELNIKLDGFSFNLLDLREV
ncbi:MAG: hypothetical protein PWP46_466 [Fusobacteriaceae bacterium]|jgi:hypothetical protein|nr:hypothetical protein [Fusobacteriaceae bacterium]